MSVDGRFLRGYDHRKYEPVCAHWPECRLRLCFGTKGQASDCVQAAGLEWLFRLATEPRYLWPRYRQYPLFAMLAIAQLMGILQFPADADR